MNTNLFKPLVLILLSVIFALLHAGQLHAQTTVTTQTQFYGYCYLGAPTGPVKFLPSPEIELTTIAQNSSYFVHAGEYADNTWYAYTYGTFTGTYSFASINLANGAMSHLGYVSGYGAYLDADYVADMTYCYKNSTMYALKSATTNILTTVDITSTQKGKHTALGTITGTDAKLITLAAHISGQLYAIGNDAKLYAIDPETLSATLIGNVGIEDFTFTTRQSMSFDHGLGTLYWLSEDGNLYTVNRTTGTATLVGALNEITRKITGIFTIFESAGEHTPTRVQNLQATNGASGALVLSLAWTNPAQTLNGDPLSALTAIKIFRNGTLYETFTGNLTLGASVNWSDPSPENGMQTYKVVPVNSNGDGAVSSLTIYVGIDIPLPVTNLVLAKDENGRPKLTWSAPTAGVNGEWIGAVTYDIVRNPGNVSVATNISATTYTDLSELELGKYTYSVTAKTSAGSSTAVQTTATVLGNPYPVPWREDFDSQSNFDLWTVIDANNDNTRWLRSGSGGNTTPGSTYCNTSYSRVTDDWLITPPIQLDASKLYVLRWVDKCLSANYTVSYNLTMGTDATITAQNIALHSYLIQQVGTPLFNEREFILPQVASTGAYHIGWHCTTPQSQTSLYLDDIEIVELLENDLKAVSLTGNKNISAGFAQTYTLVVKNQGIATVEAFTVNMYDESETLLASTSYAGTLSIGEITEVAIEWTPELSMVGARTLTAVVVFAEDQDITNNSAHFNVTVFPFGTIVSTIGETDFTSQHYMPFNIGMRHSMAQNIFFAHEIGTTGLIEQLSFLSEFTNAVNDVPVKIYMLTTTQANVFGWNKEASVLVFEGNIDIPAGTAANPSVLTIVLDMPFYYGGNNLVIRTERQMVTDFISNSAAIRFKMAKTGGDISNRSAYWSHNSMQFDWQTPTYITYHPRISIGFNINGNALSGTVTSGIGAVGNANVKILETPFETYTNAQGNYQFPLIPAGTYQVEFSKLGYETTTEEVIITLDNAVVLNAVLESSGTVSVSGNVYLDDDATPLSGVTIRLIASDVTFEALTDETGAFLLEDVYKDKIYNLHVFRAGCKEYNEEVIVEVEDVEIEDIILNSCASNPVNLLQAQLNTPTWYDIKLTWDEAIPGINTVVGHRIYKNGKFVTQIAGNINSFIDAGLAPGTYTYSVTAFWSNDCESGAKVAPPVTIELHECDVPVVQYPLIEGFESGVLGTCWTQQHFSDLHYNWQVVTDGANGPGTFGGPINHPHSGQYNLRLYGAIPYGWTQETATRLFMPLMDISGLTSPVLNFWYAHPNWFGRIDGLKVYYQNEINGEWHLIMESEVVNTTTWKEALLELPNPSAYYRIAFEGIVNHGFGVVLDDIKVMNDLCQPVRNLIYTQETEKKVVISWEIPEAFNVTSYTILRDGAIVAENITETSFTETDIAIGTYEYGVKVMYDKPLCNESEESFINVTVSGKCENVENIEVQLLTSSSIHLNWIAPNAINIEYYNIYRDDELINTTQDTEYTDEGVPEGQHKYGVSVTYFDKDCIESDIEEITILVQCKPVENLNIALQNNNRAIVTWSLEHDVASFKIIRDGNIIETTRAFQYIDRGLAAGQTFQYTVIALYDAGCESAPTSNSVTTVCDDIQTIGVSIPAEGDCSAILTWTPANDLSAEDGIVFSNGNYYSEDGIGCMGYNVSICDFNRVGFSVYRSLQEKVTDDFVLPRSVYVEEMSFYICTPLTMPFDPEMQIVEAIYVTIYDGNPAMGGTLIWGRDAQGIFDPDPEANRLKSCTFTKAFRVHPSPEAGGLESCERPIYKVTAAIEDVLPAGTYWVAFNLDKKLEYTYSADMYAVPVPNASGNAYRKPYNGPWEPASEFDGKQLALPFEIKGTPVTIDKFNIYRNGLLIKENHVGNSFTDTNIEENTPYIWEVANLCANGESNRIFVEGTCIRNSIAQFDEEVVKIYPNPAGNYVIIEGEHLRKVEIYHVTGRLVESVVFNNPDKQQVDLKQCTPGVYFFKTFYSGSKISVHKVVITK